MIYGKTNILTEEPDEIVNDIYELMDNFQSHLYLQGKGINNFEQRTSIIDIYREYQRAGRGKWRGNT